MSLHVYARICAHKRALWAISDGPIATGTGSISVRKLVPVPFGLRRDERQKVTSLLSHAFVALNEKPPLSVEMTQTVLRDGIGQRGVGRMGDRATTAACAGVSTVATVLNVKADYAFWHCHF